jgi:uncharacterized protein YijF (DUF1287 family)
MRQRNIDGGSIQLSVLRRAPRVRRTLPLGPLLAYMTFLAGVAALWYTAFRPMMAADASAAPEPPPPVSAIAAAPAAPETPQPTEISEFQQKILQSVRDQVASGTVYSGAYYKIPYPGGDVPKEVGTSADLAVRALRAAGVDLQQAIQESRAAYPERFPLERWRNQEPDPSIDHRRIANIDAWMRHTAESLSTSIAIDDLEIYRPGDFVLWLLGDSGSVPNQVGIVTDRKNDEGVPYCATIAPSHGKISDEHLLTEWIVRSHYRLQAPPSAPSPP